MSHPAALSASICERGLDSIASRTSAAICESAVSLPVFETLTVSAPSTLSEPPITSLPTFFATGLDSPVIRDSSTSLDPKTTVPSTGIFSPGFTSTTSPFFKDAVSTGTIFFPATRLAFGGIIRAIDSSAPVAAFTARISMRCPNKRKTVRVEISQ
ncbi:Uncharacterised protein [uncultured archaeon]|nr:Uncharacterised protein [uncultured archaeon]